MTILHTTNYGIAYIDAQTPLSQLADASQQAAQTIDTALGHGGVAPFDVTSLAAEVAARQSADTALGNRVTVLEPGAWTDFPVLGTTYMSNFQVSDLGSAAGSGPPKMQYRIDGHRVWLRGWTFQQTSAPALSVFTAAPLPAAVRPPYAHDLFPSDGSDPPVPRRWNLGIDGVLRNYRATVANGYLCWNGMSWGIA
jgi:hypothetical protein